MHHVSSPKRPAGSAESLPVCGARGGDSVACGGRERGATLLAAADRRGSAGCGNGCHSEVHAKCRVEMVTMRPLYHCLFYCFIQFLNQ